MAKRALSGRITAVKTTTYRTTDDKEHLSIDAARQHQFRINIDEMLEADGVGRGASWDSEMFGDWLEQNFLKIKKLSSGRIQSA